MIEFLTANMAPTKFGSLIVFLMSGYAVAFSLAACRLLFGLVGIELGMIQPAFLQSLPLRMFGIMQNDTLLANPLFTLMGLILERSGMAEALLDTIGQLFGPIRGGLASAAILVGAMLAATTGVVAVSVISMGLISLPIMWRYGYDQRVASGTIAASGTLAQIIPPSLVLIVLADKLGKSVGDLYTGAFIPGFVLTGLYIAYILLVSFIRPKWVPALPPEARTIREDDATSGLRSLSLLAIVSVIASIAFAKSRPAAGPDLPGSGNHLSGYCHTHRGWGNGRSRRPGDRPGTRPNRPQADPAGHGLRHEAVVFRVVHPDRGHCVQPGFPGRGRPQVGRASALRPAGRHLGFLIVVNIWVFVLAFFLDFFERAFIIVPLIGPVADKLGIDLVWFGVLLAVNMQTSFMHPPFDFALFYLRSVAPSEDYTDKLTKMPIKRVTIEEIYSGAVPFVLIQVLMVAMIIAFPGLVSSGLNNEPMIDADKVFQQMQTDKAAVAAPEAAASGGAESTEPAKKKP